MASLSTSASMISPLNPLPSPWATSSSQPSAFSPPNSHHSELASATSTSSGGVAIRLNRVPTSVRLAAELIKHPKDNNSQAQSSSPPSGGSAITSGAVSTPNPSPAGSVSATSHMPAPAMRGLGQFASMPPSTAVPAPPASSPINIGKGRPSLSVPETPLAGRSISPTQQGLSAIAVSGKHGDRSRQAGPANLGPPCAFKAPLPPSQLLRPAPSGQSAVPTLSEPFDGSSRRHRYRVSMHEARFKPTLTSDFTESPPPEWLSPPEATAAPSGRPSRAAAYALNLDMPPVPAHLTTPSASGSVTPGAPANQPRLRSTTGKGFQMDLAGIPGLGDAASHARMIMQSRQAKLQRWRPSSSGSQVGFHMGRNAV